MQESFFKNEHVEIWIEDGLMYHKYALELVITLNIAKEITRQRILMSNGNSYPLLLDSRTLGYITKEAREYWSKDDGIKYLTAGAFVISNPVHKIFGNMFLTVNRPLLPAKLFTNVEAGVQWLQKFKNAKTSGGNSSRLFVFSSAL